MQSVDVLRYERVQLPPALEFHQRTVSRVWHGGPGRMLGAAPPCQLPDFRIRHVVMNVGQLLSLRVLRPDALRSAKVGNPRLRGDARAGQCDDTCRVLDPVSNLYDSVLLVPRGSCHHEPILPLTI